MKRIAVIKCMNQREKATLTEPVNKLYSIKTSSHLRDEEVLPKLKFANEKNITF